MQRRRQLPVGAPTARLPQVNAEHMPPSLYDQGIEIGAGLGVLAGKIWRIGLMGYSSRVENVITCLQAQDEILCAQDRHIGRGVAMAVAYKAYAQLAIQD